ncbi:nucleotidyltransferase family protein [Arthrobacter sulfonylureivorans]|uniref:nucleotidyltransferase family protein n=1 Tax=Arthrobacter sulfonylureivorans TaxID=2486855 RepID=UPI0039E4E3AF
MPSLPERRTAALVLAAGGSRRLGRPKQLLPYGNGVLLDAVLGTARASGFDQIVLALGGAADAVRRSVDTSGCDVVDNPAYTDGCSSSIAAAVPALHPRTEAVVLLLGDQPGVTPATVHTLLAARGDAPLAVCRYDDGVGHPFAFHRSLFPLLAHLHGDKAVWKLLEQRAADVTEVAVPGRVPRDVDTEDDYRQVLAELRSTP